MADTHHLHVDLIEEFSLRRWARENYVPPQLRNAAWHPVVLQEMALRDAEQRETFPGGRLCGAVC